MDTNWSNDRPSPDTLTLLVEPIDSREDVQYSLKLQDQTFQLISSDQYLFIKNGVIQKSDNSVVHLDANKLNWGLPESHIVIPVLSDGEKVQQKSVGLQNNVLIGLNKNLVNSSVNSLQDAEILWRDDKLIQNEDDGDISFPASLISYTSSWTTKEKTDGNWSTQELEQELVAETSEKTNSEQLVDGNISNYTTESEAFQVLQIPPESILNSATQTNDGLINNDFSKVVIEEEIKPIVNSTQPLVSLQSSIRDRPVVHLENKVLASQKVYPVTQELMKVRIEPKFEMAEHSLPLKKKAKMKTSLIVPVTVKNETVEFPTFDSSDSDSDKPLSTRIKFQEKKVKRKNKECEKRKKMKSLSLADEELISKFTKCEDVVTYLGNKKLLNSSSCDLLTKGLQEFKHDILREIKTKVIMESCGNYSAQLKTFAFMVNFFHPLAYTHLQTMFQGGLPSLSVLKEWRGVLNYQNIKRKSQKKTK